MNYLKTGTNRIPDPNRSMRRGFFFRKLTLTYISDPNRYQFCTR